MGVTETVCFVRPFDEVGTQEPAVSCAVRRRGSRFGGRPCPLPFSLRLRTLTRRITACWMDASGFASGERPKP